MSLTNSKQQAIQTIKTQVKIGQALQTRPTKQLKQSTSSKSFALTNSIRNKGLFLCEMRAYCYWVFNNYSDYRWLKLKSKSNNFKPFNWTT